MADGISLEYDWYPDPIVVATQYADMADELANLAVPLLMSRSAIAANVGSHFEAGGPGWAPWAVEGGAGPAGPYKTTYTGGEGLLRDTGDLFAHASSVNAYVVDGDDVLYTPNNPPIDEYLQDGTTKMYPRPFAGLDEAGEEAVEAIFALWIDGVISSSGLFPGQSLVPTPSGVRIRGTSGRFESAF